MTSNVYARLGEAIKSQGKEYHATYTWDALSNGTLQASAVLATNTGFNFDDVLNLPECSRPDFVVPEFIWQSEAVTHPGTYSNTFNAGWTIHAATGYVAWIGTRSIPTIHPEITRQQFGTNWIPSLSEFEATLWHAVTNTSGCDFFIHHLTVTNRYLSNGTNATSYGWWAVSNVFRSVP